MTTNTLSDKVVLVTGAARGQGRAHAVRLSSEGADIIAVDIAGPLPPSVPYDSPTPDDLTETARLVAANGRRVVAVAVDTRDRPRQYCPTPRTVHTGDADRPHRQIPRPRRIGSRCHGLRCHAK